MIPRISFLMITLLFLFLSIFYSTNFLVVNAQQVVVDTSTPGTTIVSKWTSDSKFYWPNTNSNKKKITFTPYMALTDTSGTSLQRIQIGKFVEGVTQFQKTRYATINISGCSATVIWIGSSLKNVEINIFNNVLGLITIGKNAAESQNNFDGALTFENVTIRIFNNQILQTRLRATPNDPPFSGSIYAAGIFLQGSRKFASDPTQKCTQCIGFGNRTSFKIHDNYIEWHGSENVLATGQNTAIKFDQVIVAGLVEEISIQRNNIQFLNCSYPYVKPILVALPTWSPTCFNHWNFNGDLWAQQYEREVREHGHPFAGVQTLRIENNQINLTHAVFGQQSVDAKPVLFGIVYFFESTRSFGLISISNNNATLRLDPTRVLLAHNARAVHLWTAEDGDNSDQWCTLVNVSNIRINSNNLSIEAAPGLLQSWKLYYPNLLPKIASEANQYAQHILNNRQLIDPSDPGRNVANLPMQIMRETKLIRIASTCQKGFHDVDSWEVNNNNLLTPVYTANVIFIEVSISFCNTNVKNITIAYNRLASVVLVQSFTGIQTSLSHHRNLNVFVLNNYVRSDDSFRVSPRQIGIEWQQQGMGDACAINRSDAKDPDFWAYCDNCSLVIANNDLSLRGMQMVAAVNLLGEGRTLGSAGGQYLTGSFDFWQSGRISLHVFGNNLVVVSTYSNFPTETSFDPTDSKTQMNIAGINIYTPQRNYSLIDFAGNNITVNATTANLINGISSSWPGMFDASGPFIIRNNKIRIYDVWKTQVAWSIAGIGRFDFAPEWNVNSTHIIGNDIELHISEKGCSGLPCAAIIYCFGNESYDTGDLWIKDNRIVMTNDKITDDVLATGAAGFGVARGILIVAAAITSVGVTFVPGNPFPVNIVFKKPATVLNVKSIEICGNDITVSGIWGTHAIEIGIAGSISSAATINTFWYQRSSTAKRPLPQATPLLIDGNNIFVTTAVSPAGGFSQLNAAVWIGHQVATIELIQKGLRFLLPFLTDYQFGSSAEFGNFSFTNNNITLRGGVPSVITIAADVKFHTTFVNFTGTRIDSQVSVSGTIDFNTMFKGYYYESANPLVGGFGFNKGLILVLNDLEDSKVRNLDGTNSLEFVSSLKTDTTKFLFKNCNFRFETKIKGQDCSVFYWWKNSLAATLASPTTTSLILSTATTMANQVHLIIDNSTIKVIQSEEIDSKPATSSSNKPGVSGGSAITPLLTSTSTTRASPLVFGASTEGTSPHQLAWVQLTHSIIEIQLPSFVTISNSKVAPTFFLMNAKSSDTDLPRGVTSYNSSFSLLFDNKNVASGTILTYARPFVFSLFDLNSFGNFSITNRSSLSYESLQSEAENRARNINIKMVPYPSPDIDSSFFPSASTTWSLVSFSSVGSSSTISKPREIVVSNSTISLSATSPVAAEGQAMTRIIPSGVLNTPLASSSFTVKSSCVEIDDAIIRPSSLFYYPLKALPNANTKGIAVCNGRTFSKSLTESISIVPVCAPYGLIYVGDKRFTVLQTTGKRMKVSVGVIVGSDLLPLVKYPSLPQRNIPETPPPVGQDQSKAFTKFRGDINATGERLISGTIILTQSTSSVTSPLIYSTNPAIATVFYGVVDANSPTMLTLDLEITAGLRAEQDYQVEIAFSPTLLACVTPPYDKEKYDQAKRMYSDSPDPFAFGDFAQFRPKPVFYDPRNGWSVLRFTLNKRSAADSLSSTNSLFTSMKEVGVGMAIASAFTSNALAMSQLNRAETLNRFLDCGFSDDEPLDPIQAPIQIGFGTMETGYYQRAAIMGNLVVAFIGFAALFTLGVFKWKKRQRAYDRKMKVYQSNLVGKRLIRQDAIVTNLKNSNNKHRRSFSAPLLTTCNALSEELLNMKQSSVTSVNSNKNLLGFTEPVPPPPFIETLHSVMLPSHLLVPILGLLQGTTSSAVSLLRLRGWRGNDTSFAIFALLIVIGFFVWVLWVVYYDLPRHRYIMYVERKEAQKAKYGERRHVYGPAKWFPKCAQCSPESVIVEAEDMHKRHARRILPRVNLYRFRAYRILKWFLTPWGDWTLFRVPIKPPHVGDNEVKQQHEPERKSSNRNLNNNNHDAASVTDGSVTHKRSASPHRSIHHHHPKPLEKHQVPDRFFRERSDKALDDYTQTGRHGAVLEFSVAFATAVAAGMTPETDNSTDESCANTASFAMIVNVLPFVFCIGFSPYRKKTTYFFALMTGSILTCMTVIVAASKIFDLKFLSDWMAAVQLGLDFAVTVKFGVDMVEMFWLMETETALIPYFFIRHYLFHFGGMMNGIKALCSGKRYRTEYSAQYQWLQTKRNEQRRGGSAVIIASSAEEEEDDVDDGKENAKRMDEELKKKISIFGLDCDENSNNRNSDLDLLLGSATDYRKFVKKRNIMDAGCWEVPFTTDRSTATTALSLLDSQHQSQQNKSSSSEGNYS